MRSASRRVAWPAASLASLLCGAAIVAASASAVSSAHASASMRPAYVERQRYVMGTMFVVVVRMPDGDVAAGGAAAAAALDEVARLDRVLSHYDAASDLSRLASGGVRGPVSVAPDLYRVVEQALEMSRLSQGRFDITVGPYVRLWRDARERGRQPGAADIAHAASCTGSDKVELHPPDRIALHADCMALDLGAIGKGYAVDRAIDVLRARGIAHAVVNAGGSTIRAIGTSHERDGWAVDALWRRGDGVLVLRDMAMSTSLASDEVIVPHLRAPSASALGVTVTTPSATTADALSTALLLSTLDEGQQMVARVSEASAWWTRADGSIAAEHVASAGLPTGLGDTR